MKNYIYIIILILSFSYTYGKDKDSSCFFFAYDNLISDSPISYVYITNKNTAYQQAKNIINRHTDTIVIPDLFVKLPDWSMLLISQELSLPAIENCYGITVARIRNDEIEVRHCSCKTALSFLRKMMIYMPSCQKRALNKHFIMRIPKPALKMKPSRRAMWRFPRHLSI